MPALDPRLLGIAENAHRALLLRELVGTGLDYERWAALATATAGVRRSEFEERLASSLRVTRETATALVDELVAAGLLTAGDPVSPTPRGERLTAAVRTRTAAVITRIYSDIDAAELQVAGEVVSAITTRAIAELDAA
jgi:DNA-binding MarR family transcriptional regulator